MTDSPDNAIRRRPDGSIDADFYLARGRRARSRQAFTLTRAALTGILRVLQRRMPAATLYPVVR